MSYLSKIKFFAWFTFLINFMYLFLLVFLTSNLIRYRLYEGSKLLLYIGAVVFLTAPIIGRIGIGFMVLRLDRFLKKGLGGVLLLEIITIFQISLGLRYFVIIPIVVLMIYYCAMFFYFLPKIYNTDNNKKIRDVHQSIKKLTWEKKE